MAANPTLYSALVGAAPTILIAYAIESRYHWKNNRERLLHPRLARVLSLYTVFASVVCGAQSTIALNSEPGKWTVSEPSNWMLVFLFTTAIASLSGLFVATMEADFRID